MDVKQLENLLTFALLKDRDEQWHENWNSIVEYVLYQSHIPLSQIAIQRHLEGTFSCSVLTKSQLADIVSDLKKSQRIKPSGKHQLRLAAERRTLIKSRIDEYDTVFYDFSTQIIDKIEDRGRSPDTYLKANVDRAVKSFISVFLSSQTIASLSQLSREEADKHIGALGAHIEDSARVFAEPHLREFYVQAMLDSIGDERFAAFFWKALQNLICLEIMRLDPVLDDFRRHFLDSPLVYLDSNVLISLLLPSEGVNHDIARLVCSEMKRHSVIPRVSRLTLVEVLELYQQAQELMAKEAETSEKERNPFIVDYKQVSADSPLTWTRYSLKYQQLEGILQKEYGILVEDTDSHRLLSDRGYTAMSEAVKTSWKDLRGGDKSEEAIEHDTMLLLLVHNARKKARGRRMAWFVSFDLSLGLLSRALQTKPADRPLTVMAEAWVQTLSLFPSSAPRANRSLEKVMLHSVTSRWATGLPALARERVQEMLSTLEDAPKDLYHLLRIAEDIVTNERITAPTVERLRTQVKDYNGSLSGIRGYMLEQAYLAIVARDEELPMLRSMQTRYRIGLTAALMVGGGLAAYVAFTLGVNRIGNPFVFVYIAVLGAVLVLVNAVWGNKLTNGLVSLWEKAKALLH